MRIPLLLLAAATLAACADDPAVILGDLAEGAEATHVWVLGEPERAELAADSFRLEGVRGEVLDLRFARGDAEVARMEIHGFAAGERLRLRDVWFDDGVAYPSTVESDGGTPVTVNGLRMAAGESIPRSVEASATVLAVSRSGDAMIVRPTETELPDLRVVVTPGTQARTPDGDPADVEKLEFGDSVRVVGQQESGFVIATELILPRSRAGGEASRDDDDGQSRFLVSGNRPAAGGREAGSASSGAAARSGDGEARRERDKKEPGKGRGKGQEKGKGRGKG